MSTSQLRKARANAIKRQNNLCFWCAKPMLPVGNHARSATAEHLLKQADGGRHSQSNVVAAHKICNETREKRSASEPDWTTEEREAALQDLLEGVGAKRKPRPRDAIFRSV